MKEPNRRCLLGPLALVLFGWMLGCIPNNPYPCTEQEHHIFYGIFSAEPKHFDPAISYSSDEYRFIQQIYEPPLQYHYLKRPYELIPLTTESIPTPRYFDADGKLLAGDAPADKVARAVYDIHIRPGIMYQPHPCFAQNEQAGFLYRNLTSEQLSGIREVRDFRQTGTRELSAADYVLQIRRMADSRLSCPILSILMNYILGMEEYATALKEVLTSEREKRREIAGAGYSQSADEKHNPIRLNLNSIHLAGVEFVDRYTYRITLKTKYPQIVYWLAMPFFAPIPQEAIDFYEQNALKDLNITLDRFPVGTGPYRIDTLAPHKEIILVQNENFHGEHYPTEGEQRDQEASLLTDAGAILPLIPKSTYKLEKEYIPSWNKFLQGYYDSAGISSDTFDQAISLSDTGDPRTSEFLRAKNIVLRTSVNPTTIYLAFNMLDNVFGGYTEEKQKLRQAISIALDYSEYIEIFLNGRGVLSHSPIPPGIFGFEEGESGINPYVYNWDAKHGTVRKAIDQARHLLAEAGYAGGVDKHGNPLIVHFDNAWVSAGSTPRLAWMRKQLEKIGVTMENRTTDYNRFRDKVAHANFQLISWGWHADYPDSENFLFLLYGPNSRAKSGGANNANYQNTEFNRLFEQMQNMENSRARLETIRQMKTIAQRDAPWIFAYHPVSFGLSHEWVKNSKPNDMGYNTLKYKRIVGELRAQRRAEWNQPVVWPLLALAGFLIVGTIPAAVTVWRREKGR